MNRNRINEVLNPNDKPVSRPFDSIPGTKYPPKNSIEDKVLKNTIAPSVIITDKVFIFIFPIVTYWLRLCHHPNFIILFYWM
jgi:hypothetical protein